MIFHVLLQMLFDWLADYSAIWIYQTQGMNHCGAEMALLNKTKGYYIQHEFSGRKTWYLMILLGGPQGRIIQIQIFYSLFNPSFFMRDRRVEVLISSICRPRGPVDTPPCGLQGLQDVLFIDGNNRRFRWDIFFWPYLRATLMCFIRLPNSFRYLRGSFCIFIRNIL
jgi:hypothetical protein